MKIIWEVKDVRPGTLVGKSLSTERFIIAYMAGRSNRYTLVSLADGLIVRAEGFDATEMANVLTRSALIPVEFLETKFGGEQ